MSDAAQQPLGRVFLLGFYRGGTTFVQRLLNCHPDLTIWGENGGFVSRLRLMHERFARDSHSVDGPEYRRFDGFADQFDPYANPVDSEGLVRQMAAFLESIYWADREPPMWGFKEIRNNNEADITFLRLLFPDAKLILLVRQPKDLLSSDLHSEWSPAADGNFSEYVDQFVERYLSTLRAFSFAVDQFPQSAQIHSYEEFCERGFAPELCNWLGLATDKLDQRLLGIVREARTGSSFGANGRSVSEREAAAALSSLDERLARALAHPDAAREARLIERLYPER